MSARPLKRIEREEVEQISNKKNKKCVITKREHEFLTLFTYEIDNFDTWVLFSKTIPESLQIDLKSQMFDDIWNVHPKEQDIIKMYGKDVKAPRFNQMYGHSYRFSGLNHEALPFSSFPHDFLSKLLEWCDEFLKNRGIAFDYDWEWGILVNWYDLNENHYIGPHSDKEKDLIPNSPIFGFSYGDARNFELTPIDKEKKDDKLSIELTHNSVVIMGGTCQKTHKHAVPKRKKKEGECGKRINFTVRMFKK